MQGEAPREALGWLALARAAAVSLAGGGFPRPLLAPALLRIEAHRANALRLAGELRRADRVFRALSADPRRAALADPAAHAELMSLEASLRIDLRELAEAERLLVRAGRLYRAIGDEVGKARTLLQRGSAAEYFGHPERALAFHRRATRLLDPEEEPSLAWAAVHNLADSLAKAGRPAEAAAVFAANEPLFRRQQDPSVRLRRAWTEAVIARSQERLDDAEALLAEVHDGWLALGRPYEAALATLDRAELHLVRRDWPEVRRQAGLLEAVFATQGVEREARAASILVHRAAREESLTVERLETLRRYLTAAGRRLAPSTGSSR